MDLTQLQFILANENQRLQIHTQIYLLKKSTLYKGMEFKYLVYISLWP